MVTAVILALALAATRTPRPAEIPSLRDTVEIASLSGVSVSPDERWVVYRQEQASIVDNRRRLSWWAAPIDGSRPPRKVADGGQPIWTDAGPATGETPQWSADGSWFYFRSVTEDGSQVWRASPDAGRVEQVTHDAADIEAFVVGKSGLAWRVRATRQAIQRAEHDEYDNGVLIDGAVDPAQNLFEAVDVNGRFAAQRLAGQWFARRSVLGREPPRFHHADLAGRDVEAIDQAAAEDLGLPTDNKLKPLWSGLSIPGAESAYGKLSIDRPRGQSAKAQVLPPAGGPPIPCEDSLCRGPIDNGQWRPGRDVVVLTRSEPGHRQSLVSWDVGRGMVRALIATSGLVGGGLDDAAPCALTTAWALCVVADPDTPSRLERIDLDTGARAVLAAPNAALALLGQTKAEPLAWTDGAGRAFTGILIPATHADGQPPPLFLTYYSCGGLALGGLGEEWPLRVLAASGIATLCINKTAAPYTLQDSVANYQVALSGIRTIVDDLAAKGRIDRHRIGMGGLSFGSEVAMWVATESDLLSAVSISTPQLEPTYYWVHGVAGRDNHGPMKTAWGLGAPEETPERWKLVSPALKTERLHAATLMQMSEQEYRIGPELLARLSNSKTPVEAYVFAQEPHIKVQPRHKLAVYQRNLDWFRFWLQGVEDPDPAKADQYARWRALRARAADVAP